MIYKSERAKENTSNPTGKLDDKNVPLKLIRLNSSKNTN
jgi:hypothetical protein